MEDQKVEAAAAAAAAVTKVVVGKTGFVIVGRLEHRREKRTFGRLNFLSPPLRFHFLCSQSETEDHPATLSIKLESKKQMYLSTRSSRDLLQETRGHKLR